MRERPPVAERVKLISELMRTCKYQRGRTDKELAEIWGLSLHQVHEDTMEASRRVKAEIANENFMDVSLDFHLEAALHRATEAGDNKAVAIIARQWADVKRAGSKGVDWHGANRERIKSQIAAMAEQLKAQGVELSDDDG